DEVVGVDLGLRACGELLAPVLPHRGVLGGGDCLAVRGREEDLLGGELGMHFVPDVAVSPGEQPAGCDKRDREEQACGRHQDVEGYASHSDSPNGGCSCPDASGLTS